MALEVPHIPEETYLQIFKFLDFDTLHSVVPEVCQKFYRISKDQTLAKRWRGVLIDLEKWKGDCEESILWDDMFAKQFREITELRLISKPALKSPLNTLIHSAMDLCPALATLKIEYCENSKMKNTTWLRRLCLHPRRRLRIKELDLKIIPTKQTLSTNMVFRIIHAYVSSLSNLEHFALNLPINYEVERYLKQKCKQLKTVHVTVNKYF